jgi:hypothetical protein
MRRHFEYLKYVMRHKWFVFRECRVLGVGLMTAILHDWDKFLPDEWLPYARALYKPDGSKQYEESDAFDRAWLFHLNRNQHHWQYWIITWDNGGTECLPMPDVYRREMLADWHGAGMAITGKKNTGEWYKENYDNIKLHDETRQWIDEMLL